MTKYARDVEAKNQEINQLLDSLTKAQGLLNQDLNMKEAGEWMLMLHDVQQGVQQTEADIAHLKNMASSSSKPMLLQSVCLIKLLKLIEYYPL